MSEMNDNIIELCQTELENSPYESYDDIIRNNFKIGTMLQLSDKYYLVNDTLQKRICYTYFTPKHYCTNRVYKIVDKPFRYYLQLQYYDDVNKKNVIFGIHVRYWFLFESVLIKAAKNK